MIVSWHIQRLALWMRGLLAEWKPGWVKVVNPSGAEDPFPEVPNKNGRIWCDDTQSGYIARGREGGRQWVRDFAPRFAECPWVTAWELTNEPGCNSNEDLANLREFTIGAMLEATAQGIRLCLLNLPEGNPHDNGLGRAGRSEAECRAVERWKLAQLYPAVQAATEMGHLVGLHAYWLPPAIGPLDRWHGLGRVEWTVQQWVEMGVDANKLKVLVTETGIDGFVGNAAPYKGWRSLRSLAEYSADVADLEEQARALAWLETLELFTVGYERPWGDYDHGEGDLRTILNRLIYEEPPMPSPYYCSTRQSHRPAWIVLHGTEGPAEAAERWFRSPSNTDMSSAHKIICRDGRVIEIVPDSLAAHHAGYSRIEGVTVNVNLVSLGLELECAKAPEPPDWTEAQLAAAAGVVHGWAEAWGIDARHVVTHASIDTRGKTDPRAFDLAAFLARVWPPARSRAAEYMQGRIIPRNPDAALEAAALAMNAGAVAVSHEEDFEGLRCQVFRFPDDKKYQHHFRCPIGQWRQVEYERVEE